MNTAPTTVIPDTRPEVLPGSTYKRKIASVDGEINIYITICEIDGQPFEMFLNASDARFVEQVSVIMILASRLLRSGVSPQTIAEDLCDIHSPFTGHMTRAGYCPSLTAAIGEVLYQHCEGQGGD